MGKEKEAEYYNDAYRRIAEYSKKPCDTIYFNLWSRILGMISKREIIFDLGCGPGQFAQLAFNNGYQYGCGVDFSKVSIDMAKNRNPTIQNKFFVRDLRNMDSVIKLIDADVYVLIEVLEHITIDTSILKSIPKRKHIILSVPMYEATGHVRTFPSKRAVISRYGHIIEPRQIQLIQKVFILDGWSRSGIKNHTVRAHAAIARTLKFG